MCNEFQWSDSEQSEIDFELSLNIDETKVKITTQTDSYKNSNTTSNKFKYIRFKSGDIVKKIRLNLNDIRSYLNKGKRQQNYKSFLKMIGQLVEKKGEFIKPHKLL